MAFCYLVVQCNDGDYDHYEEWPNAVFEDLDDAVTYVKEDLGCETISDRTLFFKRRFPIDAIERHRGEASKENGGQSVWIQKVEFYPNEWARELTRVTDIQGEDQVGILC